MYNPHFSRWINDIEKMRETLSKDEENAIIAEYQKTGDPRLKQRVITNNMLYCVSVARKYAEQYQLESFEDLLSECVLALDVAIQKFEVSKDFKFITYANAWLVKYILEYINFKNVTVKIPDSVQRFMLKYKRNEYKVEGFSVQEIADFFKVSKQTVIQGLEAIGKRIETAEYANNIAIQTETPARKAPEHMLAMFPNTLDKQIITQIVINNGSLHDLAYKITTEGSLNLHDYESKEVLMVKAELEKRVKAIVKTYKSKQSDLF
jgi:DNA-directed RNA polymerase specialized sigma subunit